MKNMIKINVAVFVCLVAYMLTVSYFAHAEMESEFELDDHEDDDKWDLSEDFSHLGSSSSTSNPTIANTGLGITLTEVQTHNSNSNCWIIILGKVYDVTPLINTHSGVNVFSCGADNTAIYVGQHGTGTGTIFSYLKGPLATGNSSTNQTGNTNANQSSTSRREQENDENEVEQASREREDSETVNEARSRSSATNTSRNSSHESEKFSLSGDFEGRDNSSINNNADFRTTDQDSLKAKTNNGQNEPKQSSDSIIRRILRWLKWWD